jgi:RNA polymerase sigma factor (sigma-70 family)
VGRGTSGLLQEAPPQLRFDRVGEPTDHVLVAAVRRGDERAFETLYSRYNRRIHAYVVGMCKDHARAEDLTQEVFVSALRRMRETERPIAFKPWIYEIAKNACIDHFRRSRRTEEVSLQAEDALRPADHGRLVGAPSPEAAVDRKQQLDQLCGAFGGLSDVHHEILVMRELEGLSYRQIGERLGMSRPAVESTLFRARRRLTEEYDELVSGQRCLRVRGIIATASERRLGARDVRRLARHVAHCQPCRREALAAGLDAAALHQPVRQRIAAKVAALLPFPALARRLGGEGAAAPAWTAHASALSDQLSAGWTKAVAAAAIVLAGLGAGIGTRAVIGHAAPARPHHAATAAPAAATIAAPASAPSRTAAPPAATRHAAGAARRARSPRSKRAASRPARHDAARASSPAAASTPSSPASTVRRAASGSSPRQTTAPSATQVLSSVTAPLRSADPVGSAVDTVAQTVPSVTAPVTTAVEDVTAPVTQAAGDTVKAAAGVVQDATSALAPPATK